MDSESKKQLLSLINDDKVFIPIAEEAFNTVDTDRSGFIDKDEFKKCVFQVARDLDWKTLKNLMLKKFIRNWIQMEMAQLI